ncbi:Dihydroorotate dehydrogenase [Alkalispirochaeta americana]|uniref:Dihydroorotate dehydrogenase n=1 Tax=Alkalispirochaeta americana TaxID=159291 RepID=A0A1N6QWP8_9SPIO|nr:hypothetical protein [Alkalispirochaeta americana]SIQ21054.1 Dihydroorotate dehydrogenase [Alkalispirochaeta americana]
MIDLNVTYAGLSLKSPVIVEFLDTLPPPEIVENLNAIGAGAVILPPLDEERLSWSENDQEVTGNNQTDGAVRDSEKIRRRLNYDAYLEHLEKISDLTEIPLLTPLQCTRRSDWLNTTRAMEMAGASAVILMPLREDRWRAMRSDRLEKEILRTSVGVAPKTNLPVTVQLPAAPYGMQALVHALGEGSIKGIFLKSSSALTAIDIETISTDSRAIHDRRSDAEFVTILSSIQLLYRRVTPHIAARLPLGQPDSLAESLLAGATLGTIPVPAGKEVEAGSWARDYQEALLRWMRRKNFTSLFDLRGSLSESRRSSSLENPREPGS